MSNDVCSVPSIYRPLVFSHALLPIERLTIQTGLFQDSRGVTIHFAGSFYAQGLARPLSVTASALYSKILLSAPPPVFSRAVAWRRLCESQKKVIPEPFVDQAEELIWFRHYRNSAKRDSLRNKLFQKCEFLIAAALQFAKCPPQDREDAEQDARISLMEAVDVFASQPAGRFVDFAFESILSSLKPTKEDKKASRILSLQGPVGSEDSRTLGDVIPSGDDDAHTRLSLGEDHAGIRHDYDTAIEKVHDRSGSVPLALERAVHEFLRQRGELEGLSEIAAAHGVPLQLVVDAVWQVASSNHVLAHIGRGDSRKKKPDRPSGFRQRPLNTRALIRFAPLPLREETSPGSLDYIRSLKQRAAVLEAAVANAEPDNPLHQKLRLVLSEISGRLSRDWDEWCLEKKLENKPEKQKDELDPELADRMRRFLPAYALFALAHYGREVPLSITYMEWVFVYARDHFGDALSEETWYQIRHLCIRFLSTQPIRRGRGYRDEAQPREIFTAERVRMSLGDEAYLRFRDTVLHELGRRRLPPYERSLLFRRVLDLLWVYGDALLRHRIPLKGEVPFHLISYQEALRRDLGGPYTVAVQEIFLQALEVEIRREGLDPEGMVWQEGDEARTLAWDPLRMPLIPVTDFRRLLKDTPEEWTSYLMHTLGVSNGAGAVRWLDRHPMGVLGQTIVYFWGKNVPGDWRLLNSLLIYLQAEKTARARGDSSVPQHLNSMDPFDAFRRTFSEECPFRVTQQGDKEVIVVPVPRMITDTMLTLDQISWESLINRYLDDERGSYKDLAKVWDVSEQTVRLYSKGHIQKMRMENLRGLAAALAASEEQKEKIFVFLIFLRFWGFFEANFNIVDEERRCLNASPPFPSRYPVVLEWDPAPFKPLDKSANVEFQREPIASVLAGWWDEIFIFVENFADGFLIADAADAADAKDIRIPIDKEYKKFITAYLPHEGEVETLSSRDLHDLVSRLRSEHLLYSLRLRNWFEGEEAVATQDKKKMVQFYRMMRQWISGLIASHNPRGRFQFESREISYTIVSPSREFPHGARVREGGDIQVVAADIIGCKKDFQKYLVQLRVLHTFREFYGLSLLEARDLPACLQSWGCRPEQISEVLAAYQDLEGQSQDWATISDFLREPAERKLRRMRQGDPGLRASLKLAHPDADVMPVMTLEKIADQVLGDYLRAWWLQAGVRFVTSLDWEEGLVFEKLEPRLAAHPEFAESREKILKVLHALIEGFNVRSPHASHDLRISVPEVAVKNRFSKEEAEAHWVVIEKFSKDVPADIRPVFLRHMRSLLLSAQSLPLQAIIDDVIGHAPDRHQSEVQGFLLAQTYHDFWKHLRARASLIADVIAKQEKESGGQKKFQGRAGFCDDVVVALMERAPEDPLYESVTSSQDFVASEVRVFDVLGRVAGGFPQLSQKIEALLKTLDEREVEERLKNERAAAEAKERQRLADEARRREEAEARIARLESERAQAARAQQAEIDDRARRDAERRASEARRIAEEEAYRRDHPAITRVSLPLDYAVSQDFLDSLPELVMVDPESVNNSIFAILGGWFDLSRPDATVEKIVADFGKEETRDLIQVLAFFDTMQIRFKDSPLKDDLETLVFEIGEKITTQKNIDVLSLALVLAVEGYRSLRDRVSSTWTALEKVSFLPPFLRGGRPVQDQQEIFHCMIDFMSRRSLPEDLEAGFHRELEGLKLGETVSPEIMESLARYYLKHRKVIEGRREVDLPAWVDIPMSDGISLPDELFRLVDEHYPELHSNEGKGLIVTTSGSLTESFGIYTFSKIKIFSLLLAQGFKASKDSSPKAQRGFAEIVRLNKNIKILEDQMERMVWIGWDWPHLMYWAHQKILKIYDAHRPLLMKIVEEAPNLMAHLIQGLPELAAFPEGDFAVYNKDFPGDSQDLRVAAKIANELLSRPMEDPAGLYIRRILNESVNLYRAKQDSFLAVQHFVEDVLRYYWKERKKLRLRVRSTEIPFDLIPLQDLGRFPELAHIPASEVASFRALFFQKAKASLAESAFAYHEATHTDFADRLDWMVTRTYEAGGLALGVHSKLLSFLSGGIFLSLLGINKNFTKGLLDASALAKYILLRDQIHFERAIQKFPEMRILAASPMTQQERDALHTIHFRSETVETATFVFRIMLRITNQDLKAEFDRYTQAHRTNVGEVQVMHCSSRDLALWYLSHRDQIIASLPPSPPG